MGLRPLRPIGMTPLNRRFSDLGFPSVSAHVSWLRLSFISCMRILTSQFQPLGGVLDRQWHHIWISWPEFCWMQELVVSVLSLKSYLTLVFRQDFAIANHKCVDINCQKHFFLLIRPRRTRYCNKPRCLGHQAENQLNGPICGTPVKND